MLEKSQFARINSPSGKRPLHHLLHVLDSITTTAKEIIWKSTEEIVKNCVDVLRKNSKFLPVMKTRIVEFTDGGSGVGVSNRDTHFRHAERFMICDADYLIGNHQANDDSS